MKYLILQPHSDDVLFSCSKLLFDSGNEVEILTVENDPKRVKEDENLYNFLNIKLHVLETVEWIDDSYYGYYKKSGYKRMENGLSEEFLAGYYDKGFLKEIEDKVIKFVTKFKKENKGCKVIGPLGIGHPFHHWLFNVLNDNNLADSYYREFPHSYKRKGKVHMEERLTSFYKCEAFPVADFDEVKWELAKKFYKSQSSLLFFEQNYIKKQLDEELYCKIKL